MSFINIMLAKFVQFKKITEHFIYNHDPIYCAQPNIRQLDLFILNK